MIEIFFSVCNSFSYGLNRACKNNSSHLSFHLSVSKSCIWFGHSNLQSNEYPFNLLRPLKDKITEWFFLEFLLGTKKVFFLMSIFMYFTNLCDTRVVYLTDFHVPCFSLASGKHPYIFTCSGDKELSQLLSMQSSNQRVLQ